MFAYVTIGGVNEVQVYRTNDFSKVVTIPVGKLPHGVWPSGDGTRIYVGLENEDRLAAIDTLSNKVIATVPIGQAAQAINYVPNAVTEGAGTQGLQALGLAGQATHLSLVPAGDAKAKQAPTSVSLFDQGSLKCSRLRSAASSRSSPTCSRSRNERMAAARSSRWRHSRRIPRARPSSTRSARSGRWCRAR